MRMHERMVMLQVVDAQWKDHLLAMDHLKEGIGLRGYSQRDPLVEYKRESFEMFEAMMDRVEDETLRYLFLMRTPEEEEEMIRQYQQRKRREQREMQMIGAGRSGKTSAGHPAGKDWAQRSLPLRERQEIQEVSWGGKSGAGGLAPLELTGGPASAKPEAEAKGENRVGRKATGSGNGIL